MRVVNGILKDVDEADIHLLNSNPDKFWGEIKTIDDFAFACIQTLTQITIPPQVTHIRYSAFSACDNLKKAVLSEGVIHIDMDTFCYCDSLEEIVIPKSIKSYGPHPFSNCKNLKKLTLKNKNVDLNFIKGIVDKFDFDKIEIDGDEITFIRNTENNIDNEKE